MADELSAAIFFTLTKSGVVMQGGTGGPVLIDVSGLAYNRGVQSIGTSEETIALGDVSSIGCIYLKNLDATNFVEFGGTTTDYDGKLLPGDFAFLRWNKAAIYAKADTGACNVEFIILST